MNLPTDDVPLFFCVFILKDRMCGDMVRVALFEALFPSSYYSFTPLFCYEHTGRMCNIMKKN